MLTTAMLFLSCTHPRKEGVETTFQNNIPLPQRIEIPNANTDRIFFRDLIVITNSTALPANLLQLSDDELKNVPGLYTTPGINTVVKMANWKPLRETGMADGDLEVRVWIIGGFPHGLRLFCHQGEWAGFYTGIFLSTYELKPKTSWEELWKKVEALGILDLPDSSSIPNYLPLMGGMGYIVEINNGEHYRTYKHSNLKHQEYPEAKQMMEIIKTFRDEFQDSFPMRIY